MNSFYTEEELGEIGLKTFGKFVYISKKASLYMPEKISIGDYVRIDDFCIISGDISIGNYVHIAAYSALYAGGYEIELDDFATLSSKVMVYAESDNYDGLSLSNPLIDKKYRITYGKKVSFEKHTLVGSGCTVLPGVIIGEGASVGAMSLVKNSLDRWKVYAGIPAKYIKDRDRGILDLGKKVMRENSN